MSKHNLEIVRNQPRKSDLLAVRETTLVNQIISEELVLLRTKANASALESKIYYSRNGLSVQGVELQSEMNFDFFKYLLSQLLNVMNVISHEYLGQHGLDWQHCNLLRLFEIKQVIEQCERQRDGLCKNNCLAKKKLEINLHFEFSNKLSLPITDILDRTKQLLKDLLICDQRYLARNVNIHCQLAVSANHEMADQSDLLQEIALALQAGSPEVFFAKIH